MDRQEAIAVLLAARHEDEIRRTADYRAAEAMIEADEGLRAEFQTEADYYDQHGDLLAAVRLPPLAKLRILDAMRAELRNQGDYRPSSGRNGSQFPRWLGLAAALALLLGGVLFAGRPTAPSMTALREFAAGQVAGSFALDERGEQPVRLVRWLENRGMEVGRLQPDFLEMQSMGCKLYGWNKTPVALICFRTPEEKVVHLFFVPREAVRPVRGMPEYDVVAGRETKVWTDQDHAYVLVAHDPGQRLDRS